MFQSRAEYIGPQKGKRAGLSLMSVEGTLIVSMANTPSPTSGPRRERPIKYVLPQIIISSKKGRLLGMR
jgi:hypothetical protein